MWQEYFCAQGFCINRCSLDPPDCGGLLDDFRDLRYLPDPHGLPDCPHCYAIFDLAGLRTVLERGGVDQPVSLRLLQSSGKPLLTTLLRGGARGGNPGGRPKVVAEVKELARAHTGEAIETLVSMMTNAKSAPAARVSAANALLDRGYGKPLQHITGEGGPVYVARLPEPCKTVDEWVASLGDRSSPTPNNGSGVQRG